MLISYFEFFLHNYKRINLFLNCGFYFKFALILNFKTGFLCFGSFQTQFVYNNITK